MQNHNHGQSTIDIHTHYGDLSSIVPGDAALMDADEYAKVELERRLERMDGRGVDEAVIIAGHGYMRPNGLADTRRINDGIAAYRRRAPSRLCAAVGIVEPSYGPAGLTELHRCKDELGLLGISFHARFQGVPTESRTVRSYLEVMAEIGLVPFIHAFGEVPDQSLFMAESVARDFPDMTIVVLDAFSTFTQSSFVPIVAERCQNLVFDTALAHSFPFVEPLVAACGPERLMYGSDLYSWPYDVVTGILDEIIASDLDEAATSAIIGGNARALMADAA